MLHSGPCDWLIGFAFASESRNQVLHHKGQSHKWNQKKWEWSDYFDSDSIMLMILLVTANFPFSLKVISSSLTTPTMNLRGCLHDNATTFIPGRDEKLHRVYIKLCLLGCESYSAVKLMKL